METRGGFQPDADSPKIVSIGALTAELATLEVLCLPIDYMSEFSGCAEAGKMAPVEKFFLWIWWDEKNDNGTLISPAIQDTVTTFTGQIRITSIIYLIEFFLYMM